MPAVDEATLQRWRAHAEDLHSAFVREFVEAWDLCPWAQSARHAGRSHVRALWAEELDDFFMHTLSAPHYQRMEVWQLVVMDAPQNAMRWRAYVSDLEQYFRRQLASLPWAFAAFHPEHPGRPDSTGGTIGMLRRSPLPAIQLVRLDALERVRSKASVQVHALPQQNQKSLRAWLQHDAHAEQHAHWLQEGVALLREIETCRAAAARK